MNITKTLAAGAVALVIGAAPAVALASGHGKSGSAPGRTKTTTVVTATTTTTPTKAYGKYCQSESKKRGSNPGGKGTAFSACVVAAAKAAHSAKMTPREACNGDSKKHVVGSKGTPFSQCVSAIGKERAAEHKHHA